MSYPGGKNGAGVYQALINLMPPHDVYIEPFLGGGAVMRLKRPAAVNIGVDLAASAVSAMQAYTADIARRQLRALDLTMAMADPHAANGEAAGSPKSGDARSLYSFHNCNGIEFLERASFTGHELVYCDPPYLRSTRTARALYQHELTDVDHRHLLRVLRALPCMVMISGYSSTLYAKELKSWNCKSYQTTTRGGAPAAEWVWFNYPPPVELHDYRFLGADYRERERIHRKQKRWTARLRRMPVLERQALLAAIAETAACSASPLLGSAPAKPPSERKEKEEP